MRKIDRLFQEYASSHQNATNKMIHWICVPVIFFSILGLLNSIPLVENIMNTRLNLVLMVIIPIIIIYYLSLNLRLTMLMVIFLTICVILINYINISLNNPVYLYLSLFIISWIFQFVGHKIEGKKPSFLKDVQFLLIGPLWLLSLLFNKLKIEY